MEKFTKAKLFGIDCYINLDTNEVRGTNWFNGFLLDTCLWFKGTTKPGTLYYSLDISTEDMKNDNLDILKDPSNHNLTDLFERLKSGRPAEDQKFLDKCIKTLKK